VRGPSYGIATLRVDGNDIWAVYNATQAAREIALRGEPVLLEMMTYRRGHHSTSDDATRYRPVAEPQWWLEHDNPIKRLRLFLRTRGWWSEEEEATLRRDQRASVLSTLEKMDAVLKPAVSELFHDVYDVPPAMLLEQEAELKAHLARHPDAYPRIYADRS
jgi:2-oxoisovalerate dehydrogenase E1 component alpha subunit